MSFVWATCVKDWRRARRDPAGMLLSLGIPILVGGLMSLLAGGREGPKPQAHVLVVDRDDSFLSNFLVGALSQDAAGGLIRAERVEEDEGRRRVEEGKATALLEIPEGFGGAVLREEPTTLRLVTNPAQRILPGIVEEGLGALRDIVFYAHRLFGEDLRAMAEGPPDGEVTMPDGWVSDVAVRVNRAMARLEGTLFPPVIALETRAAGESDADRRETTESDAASAAAAGDEVASPDREKEPEPGFALLFVPGLLFMSFLFLAQGIADDLWEEREAFTLRRAVVSPHRPGAWLAGKVLAGTGTMGGVAVIALAAAWGWFALPWERFPAAAAWAVFSGIVLMALFVALSVHFPTRRGASVVASALVFPLLMLGGSFFPFEAMPAWMVAVGRWTPNGWALARLKDLLLGRAEPASLATSAAALLAFGAILFGLAARRIGGSFARS